MKCRVIQQQNTVNFDLLSCNAVNQIATVVRDILPPSSEPIVKMEAVCVFGHILYEQAIFPLSRPNTNTTSLTLAVTVSVLGF